MRVYISGPITGTHDFMHRFAKAEAELKKQGFSVINPAAVYMLKGWEKSCGANREYGYALAKDYIVMLEGGDNNDNS